MLSNDSTAAVEAAKSLLQALQELHTVLVAIDLPHVAGRLAEYAYRGVGFQNENALTDALHELCSAEELVKANLMLPNGDMLWDEEHRHVIAQLSKAARARQSLDQGESVTVDELAALARIAEKTVRMATNPAKPGSMRVTKNGHWASIEAAEALAWLGRRSDFLPTIQDARPAQSTVIADAQSLADACRRGREQVGADVAGLASALGWTNTQRKAYLRIEGGHIDEQMTHFPPQALLAMAQHFGLPQPLEFARQAYRFLALRHADTLADRQLVSASRANEE